MDINSVVSGIAAIKRHQQAISTDLNELKTSNQQLWQEALAARERHKKHQDTINRILKFLAGVFGHAAGTGQHKSDVSPTSPPRVVIPRKRQRLMIEDSNDPKEHNMQEVEDDQGVRGNAESSYSSVTELPPNYFPNVQAIRPTDTYSRSSTAEPSKASLSNGAAYMPATVPSDPLSPTMQSLTANQTDQGHMWSMFQHMLNSPSSMQKLMQALASQQAYPMANLPDPPHPSSPAPDIPSYPSSSSASSTSQVMMYDPNAYDVSRFHNGPVDNNLAGPMLSALSASLQHEDEHESATALEPLLDNATRLQKSYQDAHDIESDVDALQLSINTLIEGLGLDPNAIVEDHPLHDELGASQGAGGFDPSMSSSSGFAPPGGPSSSSIAPNDTSASTATSPVLEPISADPAPEFDFDNFFNELSARSAASGMQYPDVPSPFGDPGGGGHMDISGSLSNLSPGGDANPEQLAAFLDEVSSDASGPPVVPEEITATSATASGKGKKRKSDVVELLEEVARVNAEDDGDVSPQVKRKR
ncbi:hypothetical protein EUX98_g3065 [Antrodiella citrinella]|uniref:Uncharacterized protein n=1 Tax=Antrodiella citrinella TaxID=2447956 RepID=A0A4S4N094_9APHY|nr:hypothetical protein EUX98_g3065 [Antrodiella citrinella]